MKTRGGVVWPFLMLSGVLLAAGVRGVCDNNNINYAGYYNIDVFGGSTIDEKGNATRVDDFETVFEIFPAPPNSAGSREYSYWVRKSVGNTVNPSIPDPTVKATLDDLNEFGPADSICVAPPFESAGLQCVDLKDAGMYQLTPLEVDANCNLIKGWSSYMEPKTPECEGSLHAKTLNNPDAAINAWTRRGS